MVSYQFGTTTQMDAYLAAIRIPDLLFQVLIGGAVSAAFIPVLTRFLADNDRDGEWRLVSSLLTLAATIMVPFCLLLAIFAPEVMGWIAPAFPAEQRMVSVRLARILLISPVFFAIGTFATSVLNAHRRFLLAALAPTAYNLGIIGGALFLSGPFGIDGLAMGAATGAGLYLAIQIPGLWQIGLRFRPRLGIRDAAVQTVGQLTIPRTFGLAVTQLNYLAIVAMASSIPGAIAALDYAWTLMMLPLGIFAMAISTAVFPTLADQRARQMVDQMLATLTSSLRAILYLTIPAAIGLAVLSEPIVRLLLQRGEFSPDSTALTVYALRFYAIGILGQATIEILTRAFYAAHDTRTPVIVAGFGMLVTIGLGLMLREGLGHGGLALALSIASLLEATIMIALVAIRIGPLDFASIARSIFRSLLGGLVMAAVTVGTLGFLASGLRGDSTIVRAILALIPIIVGGIAYISVTLLLRSEEPITMLGLMRRRTR